MKLSGVLSVVAILLSGAVASYGQEVQSEVPGDHFSLEGALELFKTSSSPEEFERMLNSADSKVNNLDLNGDGYVDYIRVLNRYEGNVHLFILQAAISDSESQDVAVIELEKLANGKAVLQIIGDEDIYGVTTIIEPTREVRTYAGTRSSATVVNVWAWPSVQYVYSPYYEVWVSPWRWHVRPVWYHTWRPVTYVHYYNVWHPYQRHYTVCHTRRVVHAHRIYQPYRTTSVIVHNRHHRQVAYYRAVHHTNDRNVRSRNDSRRSYVPNERSSTVRTTRSRADYDMNRRSSSPRETTSFPERINSREVKRNDLQNSGAVTDRGNENLEQRTRPAERRYRSESHTNTQQRSVPVSNNNVSRQKVTSPAENRSRSMQSLPSQQRSSARERNIPTAMNRNSPVPKTNNNVNRGSGRAHYKPQVYQQSRPASMERRNTSHSNRQAQPRGSSGRSHGENRRGR